MWEIFIGSLILSLIHASIPNHWVPLITIGKTEQWNQKETLIATLITGLAHTLSTVIIGVAVGFIGYQLSHVYSWVSQYIAPVILITMGIIYVLADFRHSHHHHNHHHDHLKIKSSESKRSKKAILTSLSIAMFLTPCAELEAYYFQAGSIGWTGIFIVSAVYTLTTVGLMLMLVYLGMKGIKKLRSHYLEHHEKLITGQVLMALGVLAFFVN
jgi:nickel/cobalt transporter (NicO) family protein